MIEPFLNVGYQTIFIAGFSWKLPDYVLLTSNWFARATKGGRSDSPLISFLPFNNSSIHTVFGTHESGSLAFPTRFSGGCINISDANHYQAIFEASPSCVKNIPGELDLNAISK